ncbi:MAG: SDR family oxidoreductase [Simkaniaceae bacterium]|nr:SDR family oxidoreductase [Candidatus Sacchlamyda saccharinae]
MRVLLTGANGYIGTRLLPLLIEQGHEVIALVRNKERMKNTDVEIIERNLLEPLTLPEDIDAAYYLVHAMSDDPELFAVRDRVSALNFTAALKKTRCRQIIYLSGLASSPHLSKHLSSRLEVEEILKTSGIPSTSLRASIIIGSGSASFEMIRDLVEKLPFMVAPRWVLNKCQPIAVRDVLDYLIGVLGKEECRNKIFELGGPEAITYKDMLLRYAKVRGLKRILIPIPLLTPKLSSYWLIFITSTNYYLARSLIDSLKNDSVQTDFSINELIPKECLTYEESIERALQKIQQNAVLSSWRDSWVASDLPSSYAKFVEVPKFGCVSQTTPFRFKGDPDKVMEAVFSLGGKEGYYMNWAWKLRGLIDKTFGGVGLRRGKTARKHLRPGDALDFWRVLLADKENQRLLLFAEMRVPGEAWLEFRIENSTLYQTATFRPKGLLGRLYWYILYPIHSLIFKGLGKKMIKASGAIVL